MVQANLSSIIVHILWLAPLGFVVGAFGTLIGAGGGFILMPVLILLFPQETPAAITSMSLAVVFFNALSGSVAYGRMRRIDLKAGLVFSAATIPGAILGALTTTFLTRAYFDLAFGGLLLAVAVFLLIRPQPPAGEKMPRPGHWRRCLTEANGKQHRYSFNLAAGIGISVVVGYLSSLFGIGGGIIHVPVMVHLLNFPVHVATATSQFTLGIMAFSGSIVHLLKGSFQHNGWWVVALAAGVLAGAQVGAKLSGRIHGTWIIRALAVALGFVGIRILAHALRAL